MTMTGGHLTHKPYYSSQQRWDQVRRLRWMPGDSRSTLSLAGSVRKPPPHLQKVRGLLTTVCGEWLSTLRK